MTKFEIKTIASIIAYILLIIGHILFFIKLFNMCWWMGFIFIILYTLTNRLDSVFSK